MNIISRSSPFSWCVASLNLSADYHCPAVRRWVERKLNESMEEYRREEHIYLRLIDIYYNVQRFFLFRNLVYQTGNGRGNLLEAVL